MLLSRKRRLTHLHLSMSPLGDQCGESGAARWGEEETDHTHTYTTKRLTTLLEAAQAASTPVCHNNKTPLCCDDDITSRSAPLLDARRALPRARGEHARSAASDPLWCESAERSKATRCTARALSTRGCSFEGGRKMTCLGAYSCSWKP